MKALNRKIFVVSAILLSFLLMSIPSASSYREAVATGHSFTEEYWSIKYDVLNMERTADYGPEGPYAYLYNESATKDPFPYLNVSAEYFMGYVNTGSVQTLYMALTNFTWNFNDSDGWGLAPFQTMLQHFRTPAGKHVFVENTFAGLVAYQDYDGNGVPNVNDSLYFGYTLNSNYHRRLINNAITDLLGYSPFDEDVIPSVTPIIVNKTIEGNTTVYTFGVEYKNLIVFWLDLAGTTPIDETVTNPELILGQLVAISQLDSLNFTYKIYADNETDKVTTTTEYDIGPLVDLWIKNDSPLVTELLGGTYFPLGKLSLSRYNTSESIEARLSGNPEKGVLGFGLSVANWARIIVLEEDTTTTSENQIVDGNGTVIDEENDDRNVTAINMNVLNKPAFLIDFASKPNYTLAGDETPNSRPAPAKLYPGVRVKRPELNKLANLASYFLKNVVIDVVADALQDRVPDVNITAHTRAAFYTINFPVWSGMQINQDPTFVAYTTRDTDSEDTSESTSGGALSIDGYSILYMAAITSVVVGIIIKKQKSAKMRI